MAIIDAFSLFWPSWHFLHGPFIAGTPSSGYLFKTQAQKTRNQEKEKLRGMLKIIDWGFHDSSLLLHLLLFCVRWAKQFSYPKHELKITYAQLCSNFVLYISLLSWVLIYKYFRPSLHSPSLKWRTENTSMQSFFQVYKIMKNKCLINYSTIKLPKFYNSLWVVRLF